MVVAQRFLVASAMSSTNFDRVSLQFQRMSEAKMLRLARDFLSRMRTRRTVRDFASEAVPIDIISKAILTAGTAPSGANKQPWHFVVVSNPEMKHKIRLAAEAEEKKFYQERAPQAWLDDLAPLGTDANKPFLETAPYLIVIFAQKFTHDESGEKHKHYYTSESVGIATGMLISALHLSGLATLTHTPSPMKFLNQLLQRPDSEKPYLILVVGYPAENAQVPNITKKTFEEICTLVD